MCYNIAYLEKRIEKLAKRYHVLTTEHPNFNPPLFHSSAFTHPLWPIITCENQHSLSYFNWGLIPFFIKDLNKALIIRNMTANCIGEEAFDKPSFRLPIRKQRCIIPVSGFFEWQTIGKKKYPYFIHQRESELLSFGGIYDSWLDKDTGELHNTFSIVTTKANPLLARIHNSKQRMPLILDGVSENIWLDKNANIEAISKLIVPYPQNDLNAFTISKLITDKKQNSNTADVIKPYDYPELKNT